MCRSDVSNYARGSTYDNVIDSRKQDAWIEVEELIDDGPGFRLLGVELVAPGLAAEVGHDGVATPEGEVAVGEGGHGVVGVYLDRKSQLNCHL